MTVNIKVYFQEPKRSLLYLKKNIDARDAIRAVIYLASPALSLIIGHILMVDLRWSAH